MRTRFETDAVFSGLEGSAAEILAGARVLVGLLFAYDGVQKLLGVFGGLTEGSSAGIVLIAGGLELFGGALMARRLFTRPAAPRLTKVLFRNDDGGCHISPVRLPLMLRDSASVMAHPMAARQCIGNGVGKRA